MRKLWTLLAIVLLCSPVYAANVPAVVEQNSSVLITVGNTFQTIQAQRNTYNSLTIQNNNATDSCFIEVTGLVTAGMTTASSVVTPTGVTLSAQQASIILLAGGSYVRYYPYLPRGPIVATCATGGDSVYVSTNP